MFLICFRPIKVALELAHARPGRLFLLICVGVGGAGEYGFGVTTFVMIMGSRDDVITCS